MAREGGHRTELLPCRARLQEIALNLDGLDEAMALLDMLCSYLFTQDWRKTMLEIRVYQLSSDFWYPGSYCHLDRFKCKILLYSSLGKENSYWQVPGSMISRWIRLFVPEGTTAAAAL